MRAARGAGRRERLVEAATACFHEGGYARASIAQVAARAAVPAGAVFYYFRSKEDLARAVTDSWCVRLASYLEPLDPLPGPWARLAAFLDVAAGLADMYVAQGCPLASLTRDLRHAGEPLCAEAPRIYAVQSAWMARQFALAGLDGPQAEAEAGALMARYHGAIQMAYAQGDPGLLVSEIERTKADLEVLRRAGGPA